MGERFGAGGRQAGVGAAGRRECGAGSGSAAVTRPGARRAAGWRWAVGLAALVAWGCAPAAPATPPAPAPAPAAANAGAAPGAASSTAPTSAAAAPAAAPAPPPVALKAAVLGVTANAGIYLGVGQGYYAEEGLDLELVPFRTGVEQIPSLATGQLDVGTGATGAALFNAIAQDVPLKIVADHGGIRHGWSSAALLVRKDLFDAGRVRDYPDLRGLRFAIPSTAGASTQIELDRALRLGGTTAAASDVVELGFPETLAALGNGAIDATVTVEPFVTLAEERGVASTWRRVQDYFPVHQTGVVMYGPSILQAPNDVAVRFAKGYLRGVRDFYAMAANTDPVVRERSIAILMEQTTLKDRAMYDRIAHTWLDPDGRVEVDSVAEDLAWYVENGYVRDRLDLGRVIDHTYVERAVAQLGPFQYQRTGR